MSDLIEAFPLQWPQGQPRTRTRQWGSFKQTPKTAQDNLYQELWRMGAKDIIVSSNVGPRKQDGTLYARANMTPPDPGVAVYFNRKGVRQCIACDRYTQVHFNIHAIALTVQALRGIERWGSTEMVDKAFTGFAALPPPEAIAAWWDVLGVNRTASTDDVKARYRELTSLHHPDVSGGSHEEMSRINQAMDSFRSERAL